MNIYQAIASGKRYKRPFYTSWRIKNLTPCDTCTKNITKHHDPGTKEIYNCSGFSVDDNKSALPKESYEANDWIVEKDEEDFKDEAIGILNNILTKKEVRV